MIAIDLYFFMNAAYDLTLLCVVGIVARKRLYFGRVLAAALLGAAWSVTALIASSPQFPPHKEGSDHMLHS